jgi:hypothetical protein
VAPSRLRGGSLPQGTGRSFGRSSFFLTACAPSSTSHYTALFEVSARPAPVRAYRLPAPAGSQVSCQLRTTHHTCLGGRRDARTPPTAFRFVLMALTSAPNAPRHAPAEVFVPHTSASPCHLQATSKERASTTGKDKKPPPLARAARQVAASSVVLVPACAASSVSAYRTPTSSLPRLHCGNA